VGTGPWTVLAGCQPRRLVRWWRRLRRWRGASVRQRTQGPGGLCAMAHRRRWRAWPDCPIRPLPTRWPGVTPIGAMRPV